MFGVSDALKNINIVPQAIKYPAMIFIFFNSAPNF